jgi:hypothetical protein
MRGGRPPAIRQQDGITRLRSQMYLDAGLA